MSGKEVLISLLQCKLRPDLEFFVALRAAYNVTCDDIYAFQVYYVLITMSSCASVLYAVPADRKKKLLGPFSLLVYIQTGEGPDRQRLCLLLLHTLKEPQVSL